MKKPPFPLLAAPLLLSVSSGLALAADTATDTQTLSLTVPLVALINVEDISPTITFDAPTDAGQGFDGSLTATNNQPTVAISSNNTLAKLNVRMTNDLNANGLTLQLTSTTLCGFAQKTLSITDQKLCNIGMMKKTDGGLIISATPTAGINSMIPYGNFTTDIIYTLTQN